MEYDIIHVDDEGFVRREIEDLCHIHDSTYYGVCSYSELLSVLSEHNAKLFLLDGFFFMKPDSHSTQFLAQDAIEVIRKNYPNANIMIYSSAQGIEQFAFVNQIKFLKKGQPFEKLITELEN